MGTGLLGSVDSVRGGTGWLLLRSVMARSSHAMEFSTFASKAQDCRWAWTLSYAHRTETESCHNINDSWESVRRTSEMVVDALEAMELITS